MQTRKPLRVEVPKEEGFRLGRVGLIAIIGFAIGIVWPRLAGVRLVPSVPNEKSETNSSELSGAPVDSAPAASAAAAPDVAPPPAAASAPPEPPAASFTVGSGEVASCRDGKKRHEKCDPIDFDGVARGRIATLQACDVASRAVGVLSLGFELDFEKDRVTSVQSGKSTSLTQADSDALLACLKRTLGEVSLAGIHHQHERYTVYYKVEFKGAQGDKNPELEATADAAPASGKATVAWDVALVRNGPAREKEVVARVLQGTRVNVVARSGDWYRVKYDAKGNEGWVFRTAIGM